MQFVFVTDIVSETHFLQMTSAVSLEEMLDPILASSFVMEHDEFLHIKLESVSVSDKRFVLSNIGEHYSHGLKELEHQIVEELNGFGYYVLQQEDEHGLYVAKHIEVVQEEVVLSRQSSLWKIPHSMEGPVWIAWLCVEGSFVIEPEMCQGDMSLGDFDYDEQDDTGVSVWTCGGYES